ncbi:hypothetical protein C8J57DRAFT_1732296 [Mycena rebaudengoi]|nr:hypothetical protein C8J57DRAFT_1732296 [Mycena rebaudengoi]
MSDPLSLAEAKLLATFISCLLYGVYLVTLGMTVRVLVTNESGKWRTRSELNWIAIAVCAMLFTNATVNIVLTMVQVMYAFVGYTGPGGATRIFLRGSSWQTMAKTFSVGLQSLIGDGLLIYRCWFLWHAKSWMVAVFPAIIWLANCAIHIRVVQLLSQVTQGLVTGAAMQPWGQAFWILTICINITSTGLIVLRIWKVEKQQERFRAPRDNSPDRPPTALGRAMRNIVESGMIYTVASILMFAAFTAQSTLNYPASALEIHSVGITFNLIIIRGANRPIQDRTGVTPINFSQTPAMGIRNTTAVVNDSKTDSFALSGMQKESQFTSV